MSAVGSGGVPSISLAQSLASSQRPDGPAAKADAAAAATAWEQRSAGLNASGDVADVDLGADRDADGRLLSSSEPPPEKPVADDVSEEAGTPVARPRLPPDPHGKLGLSLDVEV